MWRVIISCSAEAWKAHAVEFKAIAQTYPGSCISSKKMPDGQRFMEYKIEDVSDAESFQDDCLNLSGFTAQFESL
jgi:hypothetical protein